MPKYGYDRLLPFADLEYGDFQNSAYPNLDLHGANLNGADCWYADFSGVNLAGANLTGVNFKYANLAGADLSGATLVYAKLERANLTGANLAGANLDHADLEGTNFTNANLTMANLHMTYSRLVNFSGANLSGANLFEVDLDEAELDGIIVNELTQGYALRCPPTGEFTAYKKAMSPQGYPIIVELRIPADAERSSATGTKCRADFADVVAMWKDDQPYTEVAHSSFNYEFTYEIGARVTASYFEENRWIECGGGIHFFLERAEAEQYLF